MPTILLIDDNDQYRIMLNKVLSYAGYEVCEAKNGKEAVRAYRERPIDLVITDLIMPQKDGLEVIMELRDLNPEVRIIAISGGGRVDPENYLELAQGFGAQRVLAKPFSNQQLLEAIRESIGI